MAERRPPAPTAGRATAGARARRWLDGPVRRLAQRRVEPRRLARWLLVSLAVVVPCVAWGVATAAVEGTLGPHTARYEVTVDSEVTVDLGPLGTFVIDSPAPVLGARVVVQEIPRDVRAVEAAATLEALAGDLEEYIQFFNGPQTAVEAAVRALVADAVRRSLAAVATVTATLVLLRALLGERRRAELLAAYRPHHAVVVSAATALVLVVGTVTASEPLTTPPNPERTASAVFDGTPLEGARITGRLAGVIDTYGGYAVDAYRENQAFYAKATANVEAAWVERMDHDQQVAAASAALALPERTDAGTEGPADPTEVPATETPETQEPATEEPSTEEEPEPVVMLVVSDLHCNVGMVGPIRAVTELSGASVVLNAGDTTVNGSVVESYCVTQFVDAVGDAEMVAVMGNHDGPDTAQQARDAGVHLLEGEVVEVEGIRILGDADPRASRIGVGTTLRGPTTLEQQATALADVACADDDGVDLLLVHDPAVGAPTLAQGCAPAQVSGHMHRREGPAWVGGGARYVSSSTAGATLNQPTLGPLTGVAEMTVLRLDPETGRVIDYRVVQVRPDGTASVWAALAWPMEPRRPTPRTPYL